MSNNRDNYWDDEDDEDDTVQPPAFESETDLVRKLRKALKAEQKRNKELETSLGDLSKAQRERVLKDVFTSRGVNTKVMKFVPNDLDASEESINSWLEENADVFGFTVQSEKQVNERDLASLRQMDIVTQGALSPDRVNNVEMQLENATSEEEILSILRSQQ
jgi:hypothetical protein